LCALKYVVMAVSVHVTGDVPGCYRAGCPGSVSVVARRPARRHPEAEREVGGAGGAGVRGEAGTRRGAYARRPAAGRRREKARGKGAAAVRIRAISVRVISAGKLAENSPR
jgi:hypothetical protein